MMESRSSKKALLIVAHPDDETLWAGGTVLSHPSWEWFILCLCRGSDADRAPKFTRALEVLRSEGIMGDLNDGPDQDPIDETEIQQVILDLLPVHYFDLIISHHPAGEYTRHIRHEETGKAVINLWHSGKISAGEFWAFAYEDGNKNYLPRPIESTGIYNVLSKHIWRRKYSIITETYGFKPDSFEARTTPRAESFWPFKSSWEAKKLLKNNGSF